MKASELIKELERLMKDDDPEVVVAIGSYYSAFPISYEDVYQLNRYTGNEIRLEASLGEGFVIRKKG